MKKIYAMFVAALMSVSLFAAPTTSPSKTDLENAGYAPDANVVLCLYFDDAPCNPVMLVGDYAETDNWSLDPSKNKTFAKLAGFDGWYAVEFPWKSGVMAKPIQLKEVDGEYVGSWDFQSGDKDAWVAMDGSAIAEIETENGSESKVVYPAVGAYIYELKYWKNHKSPCVVIPKYNYTIYLFDPECEANDFKPAIIGDFDNWSGTPMSKTTYEGDEAYMYLLTDEADHKIKFREASTSSWANQLQYKDSAGNWKEFADYVLPAVKNGTDTTIVFDYYDPNQYRYPLCGVAYYKVTIKAALPAGAPAAGVDLMGDFKNGVWDGEGLLMTLVDGKYTAEVEAYESNAFKFRETGNWDNQIQIQDPDSVGAWKNMDNLTFGEWWAEDEANPGTYIIDLDLSDPAEYKWTTEPIEGIENITLTEKARKVVVDGVIYIIRNNKMFNLQGVQVR